MKYNVGGAVHASTYIGEIEADSPEQAIEKAYEQAHVSVCHQCARDIQDPEVANLWAEDADGNVTQESSADARALADVRTLDDWRAVSPQTRDVYLRGDTMVVLRRHDYHQPWCFDGTTPDEARAKAAAFVRELNSEKAGSGG